MSHYFASLMFLRWLWEFRFIFEYIRLRFVMFVFLFNLRITSVSACDVNPSFTRPTLYITLHSFNHSSTPVSFVCRPLLLHAARDVQIMTSRYSPLPMWWRHCASCRPHSNSSIKFNKLYEDVQRCEIERVREREMGGEVGESFNTHTVTGNVHKL